MNVITGREAKTTDPKLNAVINFYNAFNGRDSDLMRENWARETDIVMANPLGGIKKGWVEIRSVYESIFNGPATVYVEFYDFTLMVSDSMFTIAGRERGSFKSTEIDMELAIRTSRVYKNIDGEWKQIHHHGSIEDPELLKKYQSTLMNS